MRKYSTISSLRILAVATALSMFLTGCGGSVAANADASPVGTAVEVTQLTKSDIRSQLTYIGQVEPQRRISVASRLAAEVKEVFFDVGDYVEEGDILFTVDAKDIEDQIRSLQASSAQTKVAVDQAAYGLQTAEEGSDQTRVSELQYESGISQSRYGAQSADLNKENAKDNIDAAEDNVSMAEASLALEQAKLNQLQLGYSTNTPVDGMQVTKEWLATQQAEVAKANASVSVAQSGLEAARNGKKAANITANSADSALNYGRQSYEAFQDASDQSQVRGVQQAQFGLRTAEAVDNATSVQLDIVQSNLGYAQVKSPLSGVISARSVEVGQMISQAVLPFTVIAMDTVNVEVGVSETLINSIFNGDMAEVRIQAAGGGDVLSGIITAVSPAAGANSTYAVRVELNNEKGAIKPGMFAQVSFVQQSSKNTFGVDKNVIQTDETGSYVFVVENDTAKRIPVTTGISNGTTMEIVEGVREGDEIVVVGQEYLADGTVVNVVRRNGQLVRKDSSQQESAAQSSVTEQPASESGSEESSQA